MAAYFGNDGLILEAAGELSADRYGLWGGAVRYKIPRDGWTWCRR
jgi:hypothetical protein